MKSYKSYKKLRTSYEKVTKSYEKLQKVTNELRGLIFRASFPKSWKNGLSVRGVCGPHQKHQRCTFGPYMWTPSAPTPKRIGDLIWTLCAHLRSPTYTISGAIIWTQCGHLRPPRPSHSAKA